MKIKFRSHTHCNCKEWNPFWLIYCYGWLGGGVNLIWVPSRAPITSGKPLVLWKSSMIVWTSPLLGLLLTLGMTTMFLQALITLKTVTPSMSAVTRRVDCVPRYHSVIKFVFLDRVDGGLPRRGPSKMSLPPISCNNISMDDLLSLNILLNVISSNSGTTVLS